MKMKIMTTDINKHNCYLCGEEKDTDVVQGEQVCESCCDDLSTCDGCGDFLLPDNFEILRVDEFTDHTLCRTCYGNRDRFECDVCGDVWDEDYYGGNGRCQACANTEDHRITMRDVNLACKDFQSEDDGKIIKGAVRFGVELEVFNEDYESASEGLGKLPKPYGIAHDGSIQGPNAVEIVSPILQGAKGEQSLLEVLKLLRDHRFDTNKSCGLHVHLDSKELVGEDEYVYQRHENVKETIKEYHNKGFNLRREVTVNHEAFRIFELTPTEENLQLLIDRVTSFSFDPDKRFQEITYGDRSVFVQQGNSVASYKTPSVKAMYIWGFTSERADKLDTEYEDDLIAFRKDSLEFDSRPQRSEYFSRPRRATDFSLLEFTKEDRFEMLRDAFMFFTAFNDVFLAMLPEDRRDNDRYCRKLTDTYSTTEIRKLRNQGELEAYLYGMQDERLIANAKRQHRQSIRYHGVNFHSLFSYGTIEVRWHGGTLEDDSVLYWIALQQRIIEMAKLGMLQMDTTLNASKAILLKDKVQGFISVLGIKSNSNLYKYIHQRIEHCTGTNLS